MRTYRTISDYFASVFDGKVRKVAVNAGLGCPNRDGTLGSRGCIYCNNAAFNPSYAYGSAGSITSQLEAGISFNSRKAAPGGYLAYFQSYTNTYGPSDRLIALYEEALRYPGIRGLVIATRPDCLAEDLVGWFSRRFGKEAPDGHPFLLVEIGIESTEDRTLKRIGRSHDYACAVDAVRRLDAAGIPVGVHLILGLPGETEEDFLNHARRISALPVTTLKLHQLQVVKGTPLAGLYERDPESLHLFTAEEYAATVCRFINELRPDIALDRFVSESPAGILVAPKWGLKPSEFQSMVDSMLERIGNLAYLCGNID